MMFYQQTGYRNFELKTPIKAAYVNDYLKGSCTDLEREIMDNEVLLQFMEYLDEYEKKNPEFKFERHKWGARLSCKGE